MGNSSSGMQQVTIPLENALVFTAVHCGLIYELGMEDCIGGVCERQYIHCLTKDVVDCGNGMSPNQERIIQLNPDAMLVFGLTAGLPIDDSLISRAKKVTDTPVQGLTSEQKVLLNRKGNTLLNNGKVEEAKIALRKLRDEARKEIKEEELSEDAKKRGEKDVDDATKEGFIHFEKGNVIVFEFIPQYGYQLTSVNMNGLPLTPQNDANQYILDTASANGNGHFSATFTKTGDVVKTYSSAITGGVLDLSNGAIDAGTGVLSVNDFAPSAEQATKFAETASGYEIADYLDLDMQQVFYKGVNDDTDVWSNNLTQLSADANISLKLAEGVDGNDVVIVHEKHDGTYELISGIYDAATNTVSFATDGFSNYAIAYRTVAEAPDTGFFTSETSDAMESIIGVAVMTIGSVVALYIVSRKTKKNNSSRIYD